MSTPIKVTVCLIGGLFLLIGFAGLFIPGGFAGGMGLSFASEEGAAKVIELAGRADVVVENFKLGGLKAYGLDHESLLARHPHLRPEVLPEELSKRLDFAEARSSRKIDSSFKSLFEREPSSSFPTQEAFLGGTPISFKSSSI